MAEEDRTAELTRMFAEAGKAHHEAFIDAGGADPEWPLWYAEHLLEPLNETLPAKLTKSELCYLLVAADREMHMLAPGSDWHSYFARFFSDRYE